ncbi:MAG: hypothetical protein QM831_37790 [Kofleriaceae bacterium]
MLAIEPQIFAYDTFLGSVHQVVRSIAPPLDRFVVRATDVLTADQTAAVYRMFEHEPNVIFELL